MKAWQKRTLKKLDEKGITKKALAEKIGLKAPALGHYLSGYRPAPLETIEKIADGLGVNPEWLLYGVSINDDRLSQCFTHLRYVITKHKRTVTKKREIELASRMYNMYGTEPLDEETAKIKLRADALQLLGGK